ncbi:MAG: response regulator [Planctomycetota bacterium]|nr:MAG: response regulator [Planctomycetota bacterium]
MTPASRSSASAGQRITALLVDDEPLASERLRQLLAAIPGIEVVATATSVAEARKVLEASEAQSAPTAAAGGSASAEPIDVVFLDVEMPGGSGLALLAAVPRSTVVVFVTAYPDYALQAFGVGALDYLLKPVDPERLEHTVQRVRQMVNLLRDERDLDDDDLDDPLPAIVSDQPGLPAAARLVPGATIGLPLAAGRGEQRVPHEQICWIEALRNYSWLFFREPQRRLLTRRRLAQWEAELPAEQFVRLGKSLLVNVALVTQSEWVSRDATLLSFLGRDDRLTIGRMASSRLRELLGTRRNNAGNEGPSSA